MIEHSLLLIISIAFTIMAIRYWRIKRQIKAVTNQLRETPRRRLISIELIDKDLEALTLEINTLIEEYSQMLLEQDDKHQYLKGAIADISHDMRTPLTSIIGYLQLLGKTKMEGEPKQYLTTALDKSQYLRKLLDDFYELSVLIVNDKTTLKLSKVDLAGVVSEVILDNANEFAKRGIIPEFDMSDKPAFISADTKKLRRIIENLVSNCLKYSSGDVVFSIIESDAIALTIKNPVDNIDEIDTTRLFERFYKASFSRGAGTGLGLSIARMLTDSLRGQISAEIKDNLFVIELIFSKHNGINPL